MMDEQVLKNLTEAIVQELKGRKVTLEKAQKLSAAVRAKAKEIGVKAVVAVANEAGHPILLECEEDSYLASFDVALQKSYTVVALKMSTMTLKPLAQPGGSLYGIQFTNQGKIVIFGGGEALCAPDGAVIGGLGVSGGSEEQDAALAAFGKEVFEKGL